MRLHLKEGECKNGHPSSKTPFEPHGTFLLRVHVLESDYVYSPFLQREKFLAKF
jgi:hypothetical protein